MISKRKISKDTEAPLLHAAMLLQSLLLNTCRICYMHGTHGKWAPENSADYRTQLHPYHDYGCIYMMGSNTKKALAGTHGFHQKSTIRAQQACCTLPMPKKHIKLHALCCAELCFQHNTAAM